MAWIAPVLEPVHLMSSTAEAASGDQFFEPRPATETRDDSTAVDLRPTTEKRGNTRTDDAPHRAPPAVPAEPADRVVQVLGESATRERAASPTARATPASVNFVG